MIKRREKCKQSYQSSSVHYQGTHPACQSKSINTITTRKDKLAVQANQIWNAGLEEDKEHVEGHLVDMILAASTNHNFANASVE
jgi:hypothetical protein